VQILYLSLSYLPSRRASSVQVMRMCDALAAAGHDVTLVAKAGPALGARDDHAFYGTRGFHIVKLARPSWRGGGVVFTGQMAVEIVRRRADLVYSRDLAGAMIAGQLRRPFVYEAHGIPANRTARWLLGRVAHLPTLRGLVAISRALRDDLAARGLVPAHAPTIVAHDAAAISSAAPRSERAARPRLGYVGNLYPGRGIELVIELAARMPACDVVIVGGSPADIARWQPQAPGNVSFRGFVEPARLAEIYAQLDVVLMPYPRSGIGVASGANDTSRWCSPMKMFEYMASGAPIVSSDLPVLQEVLRHERDALIAPADDVDAWRAAVQRLLDDPALSRRLATTAREELARDHTWDARVRRIMTELRV
jgi:glycosyltransferase involved in cell wall biosynthesis